MTMNIRIFSPIARTGLRDRKCDTVVRELAVEEKRIARLVAQRDAIDNELAERKAIHAALSDCLSTLTIDAEIAIEFNPEELAIDFQQAAE